MKTIHYSNLQQSDDDTSAITYKLPSGACLHIKNNQQIATTVNEPFHEVNFDSAGYFTKDAVTALIECLEHALDNGYFKG